MRPSGFFQVKCRVHEQECEEAQPTSRRKTKSRRRSAYNKPSIAFKAVSFEESSTNMGDFLACHGRFPPDETCRTAIAEQTQVAWQPEGRGSTVWYGQPTDKIAAENIEVPLSREELNAGKIVPAPFRFFILISRRTELVSRKQFFTESFLLSEEDLSTFKPGVSLWDDLLSLETGLRFVCTGFLWKEHP